MTKKKRLSKDLYAIAKKCPHLQICKSTKKGTWLDCRLKKGCACSPGAYYCAQVQFAPLSIAKWLESTPDSSMYEQEPRVNWAIDAWEDTYKGRDGQSIKNFLGEMEQDVQEKEDEKSTITDKQLDKMIADLSDDKSIQEVILETIQGLQRDVNLINEKLAKLESISELNKYKQTLGDAYLIYPAFRPVHLYRQNGHYLYSYYNETLGKEIISDVTGVEKFVNMDELNISLYRRYQELTEQTSKFKKERQEILQQLREQGINL